MSVSDGSFDVDLKGKMWGLNATPSNLIDSHTRRVGHSNTGANSDITLPKNNHIHTSKLFGTASKSTATSMIANTASSVSKKDHANPSRSTDGDNAQTMSIFSAMQHWSNVFHGPSSNVGGSTVHMHHGTSSDGMHVALDVQNCKSTGLNVGNGAVRTLPLALFMYAYILLFALTIVVSLIFMNYLNMAVRILKLIVPCFTVLWALQGYVIYCLYPPYALAVVVYVFLLVLLVISNFFLVIMPSISFVTVGLTYCCFATTFVLSLMYVLLCGKHGWLQQRSAAILTALSFMVTCWLIMGYEFHPSTRTVTGQAIRDNGSCIVLQIYTVLALSVYYSATNRKMSLCLHVQ